jgi:hypothetical protein
MKNLLYLFIASTFLISCSSNDNDSSIDPIIGEWQLTSLMTNGKELASDCDKKTTLTFFENGTGASINFDFISNNCETFTRTSTWVNIGDSKYNVVTENVADTHEIVFSNNNSVFKNTRTVESEDGTFLTPQVVTYTRI